MGLKASLLKETVVAVDLGGSGAVNAFIHAGLMPFLATGYAWISACNFRVIPD